MTFYFSKIENFLINFYSLQHFINEPGKIKHRRIYLILSVFLRIKNIKFLPSIKSMFCIKQETPADLAAGWGVDTTNIRLLD